MIEKEKKEPLQGGETTRILIKKLWEIYNELKKELHAKTAKDLCKALIGFEKIDNSSLMTLIKHIPNFEILHKQIQENLINNLENDELLEFIETFDFSEKHITDYYNQAFEHIIPPEVKEIAEKLIEENNVRGIREDILTVIAETHISGITIWESLPWDKIESPIETEKDILLLIEWFQKTHKSFEKWENNKAKKTPITTKRLIILGLVVAFFVWGRVVAKHINKNNAKGKQPD